MDGIKFATCALLLAQALLVLAIVWSLLELVHLAFYLAGAL